MGSKMRAGGVLTWVALSALAGAGACGDGDPDDSSELLTTGAGAACATGGAGGNGGGCATGGSGAVGASGGASASGTATGSGASGATGGNGGGGSGGGCAAADTNAPPVHPCLDERVYGDFFALVDRSVCVTAMYQSQVQVGANTVPSWGKHGGPLLVYPAGNGAVDLVRLTPPVGQTGSMTSATENVPSAVPGSSLLGPGAVDLPFFEQTAFSWIGAGFPAPGEIVLASGASVERYPTLANALAGAGDPCQPGRLLYTGDSLLGTTTPGEAALYAADSCGDGAAPHFAAIGSGAGGAGSGGAGGGGGADCDAPLMVHAWGDLAGPVAVDSTGNIIAIMTSASPGNEARGFAAAEIGRGQGPTAGTPLFTLPGFGNALAAMAPTATDVGKAVFQPTEGGSGENPKVQHYAVNAGKLVPVGGVTDLLDLNLSGTIAQAFNDRSGRIWIAISNPVDQGVFFVIERAP